MMECCNPLEPCGEIEQPPSCLCWGEGCVLACSLGPQEELPFLSSGGAPAHCAAESCGGWAAGGAAPGGCASAAAADLLKRLCARDAGARLLPSQALYLPVLD